MFKRNLMRFLLFSSLFLISCFPMVQKETDSEDLVSSGMKEIKKGTAWYNRGCYERSLNNFMRAHEIFSGEDMLSGVAMSLNNISSSYRAIGNIDKAEAFLKEAYTIYSEIEDYKGRLQTLSNTAALMVENGREAEALKIVEKGDEISRKNNAIFAPLLNIKAAVMIKKNEYDKAEKLLNISLHKAEKEDSEYAEVNFLLAKIMIETGRYEEASKYLDNALTVDRKIGFYKGVAADLENIAAVKIAQNRKFEAVSYLKRSVKIYALIGKKEKCLQIISLLQQLAKESNMDITITKYFTDKWLRGDILEDTCE